MQISENSMKRLEKARAVFRLMMTTISFFWKSIGQFIAQLHLDPAIEDLVQNILIPALYLEKAAGKAKGAPECKRIRKLASELMGRLKLHDIWFHLSNEQQKKITAVAQQCADLFQRSSSCVEGRNGYLSLHHHSAHRLSKRKLGALTVIHNYFIKRNDLTTAAERFLEEKPRDLFQYLLGSLDVSARPAKSRRSFKMAA